MFWYSRDSDSDDEYDFDYDEFGWMMSEALVAPDDPKSWIERTAEKGDADGLKAIIRGLKKGSGGAEKLRVSINTSQRWTEVDYKMGGYTKEWEWHNVTPLAAAALKGHSKVVRVLLETGVADPTLSGCPTDNEYYDAFEAAEKGGCEEIKKMLEAVKPFWKEADYRGSRYSAERKKKKFNNSCTDLEGMLAALAAVNPTASK